MKRWLLNIAFVGEGDDFCYLTSDSKVRDWWDKNIQDSVWYEFELDEEIKFGIWSPAKFKNSKAQAMRELKEILK
jgi:hypothetical protein